MGMCVKRGALSRMFGLGYASGVCFGVCFGVDSGYALRYASESFIRPEYKRLNSNYRQERREGRGAGA